MDITTEVRPGANRYACGEGLLQDLPSYLAGFRKISVITGKNPLTHSRNTIAKSSTTLLIATTAAQATKMLLN